MSILINLDKFDIEARIYTANYLYEYGKFEETLNAYGFLLKLDPDNNYVKVRIDELRN